MTWRVRRVIHPCTRIRMVVASHIRLSIIHPFRPPLRSKIRCGRYRHGCRPLRRTGASFRFGSKEASVLQQMSIRVGFRALLFTPSLQDERIRMTASSSCGSSTTRVAKNSHRVRPMAVEYTRAYHCYCITRNRRCATMSGRDA